MRKSMAVVAASATMLATFCTLNLAFGQRGRLGENAVQQAEQAGQAAVQGQFGQRTQNQQQFQQNAPRQGQQFGRTQAGFRGQPQARPSLTDWQIAEWLVVDNQGEIALAQQAEKSASSNEVKKFAQEMLDDHNKFLQKLERLVGVSAQGAQQRGGQQAGGRQQMQGLDIVMIKQQLGEQCRNSKTRELQQKQGSEFDKCYMGMQIGMHMEMLDTLKVFSRYASQQLDQLIEEGEQTTQTHLEHAKHIMASLEGKSDSSARSARRESRDRDSSTSSDSDQSSSESSNKSKND